MKILETKRKTRRTYFNKTGGLRSGLLSSWKGRRKNSSVRIAINLGKDAKGNHIRLGEVERSITTMRRGRGGKIKSIEGREGGREEHTKELATLGERSLLD